MGRDRHDENGAFTRHYRFGEQARCSCGPTVTLPGTVPGRSIEALVTLRQTA
jgi:hypothetical protein